MNSDTVSRWLVEIGKDRQWLASQLGKSLGTVNNWFSQGFPKNSQAAIQLLMAGERTDREHDEAIIPLGFSWTDLEALHVAAADTGMGLKEFMVEAIRARLREQPDNSDID